MIKAIAMAMNANNATANSRPGIVERIKEAVAARVAQYRDNRQAKEEAEKERQLNRLFDVEERTGRLYITCDGVATQELPSFMTASEIAEALRTARRSARIFNLNK